MHKDYIPALRFKALTRFYDPVVRFTTRERTVKQSLVENAAVPHGATVLDVACGTGTLTTWIKKQHPDARVFGVDADPEILDYARDKAQAVGVDIEFANCNAVELPFDDDSVERVVSSLFFHHLLPADKQRVLRELLRVMSEGGELHISDWGAPANMLMHAAYFPIRVLDGFPNTRDSVKGMLPDLLREAGARKVEQYDSFNTIFGTLRLLKAQE